MSPSILGDAADKLPPKRKGLKGDPVVWAEDDESEVMEWLWEFKIPARGLQLFAGDSEHGKSTITCDLAARITSGADWPDGRQGGAPRRVILMSDEDDYEGTILPRFLAAGGDQSKLGHIPMTRRFYLDDKKDLGWLRYHMILSEPALIIVDPLDDYLSGQVDSHTSKSVRRGLMAVHVLATEHRVPVLAIMHLNKMVGQNALQRLTGSVAYGAVPRNVLVVAKNTEGHSYFGPLKASLMANEKRTGFPYTLESAPHPANPKYTISRVKWGEECEIDMKALLERPETKATKIKPSPELDAAEKFYQAALADGQRHTVADIEEAREKAEISEPTAYRARKKLGIKSERGAYRLSLEGSK